MYLSWKDSNAWRQWISASFCIQNSEIKIYFSSVEQYDLCGDYMVVYLTGKW